ncbi:hypothetical protein [Streptomyces pseudovenezuelae]|uniref:hypothetical protein n=1 Tax=Streptomyces pseudovenezuelae TaxID=67350 RepID=UPI0036EB01E3
MADDELEVVEETDRFLRELRLARGRAETTTKAYAEAVVLFLVWCATTGREWRTAARDVGLFMLWLKWTPGNGGQHRVVVPGPGAKPVGGERRINKVLIAVRMFLVHAVVNKVAPTWVLEQIYELGDDRDLPHEARGESGALRYRMRARQGLQEPESAIDRASDEEIVAMFLQCRSARDRLISPRECASWGIGFPSSLASRHGASPGSGPHLTWTNSSAASSCWNRNSHRGAESLRKGRKNLRQPGPPTGS